MRQLHLPKSDFTRPYADLDELISTGETEYFLHMDRDSDRETGFRAIHNTSSREVTVEQFIRLYFYAGSEASYVPMPVGVVDPSSVERVNLIIDGEGNEVGDIGGRVETYILASSTVEVYGDTPLDLAEALRIAEASIVPEDSVVYAKVLFPSFYPAGNGWVKFGVTEKGVEKRWPDRLDEILATEPGHAWTERWLLSTLDQHRVASHRFHEVMELNPATGRAVLAMSDWWETVKDCRQVRYLRGLMARA